MRALRVLLGCFFLVPWETPLVQRSTGGSCATWIPDIPQ